MEAHVSAAYGVYFVVWVMCAVGLTHRQTQVLLGCHVAQQSGACRAHGKRMTRPWRMQHLAVIVTWLDTGL